MQVLRSSGIRRFYGAAGCYMISKKHPGFCIKIGFNNFPVVITQRIKSRHSGKWLVGQEITGTSNAKGASPKAIVN